MFKYLLKLLFEKLKSILLISVIAIVIMLPYNSGYTSIIDYFFTCFVLVCVYFVIVGIHFYIKNKSYKAEYDYLREIPRDYSPSMVSFLANMKFENKKDILADLIFLEQRKIIKINDDKSINIENESPNLKKYETHLEYLLDVIKNTDDVTLDKIINKKDIYSNYKNLVINDLKTCQLVVPYSVNNLNVIIMVIIFIVIYLLCANKIFSITSFISDVPTGPIDSNDAMMIFFKFYSIQQSMMKIIGTGFIAFGVLFALRIVMPYIKSVMRSEKGKKDVSLWLSYYRFLKDFSVMEERNFEEKNLWGYYFAYGLALGINTKVIKKFNLEYEKYIIK